ncbi:hypothetical protein HNP88_000803 [Methanococcus maripaludis]|uniref:Uncharacterized protein n=1 Tax=Methanococcus maripaludis TaxID=39152 RepID=A0A7J9NNJ9_METMI|nr:hypothetical protein [Methanococcus maripaludis]MBA2846619.1 hypothetical protein [Methanococcus maripaludis]
MGADLYIEDKIGNNLGYFRDAYNDSNVFWKFEGSYWEMIDLAREEIYSEVDCEKAISYMEKKLANDEVFEKNISDLLDVEQEYFKKEAKDLKKFVKVARDVLNGNIKGRIIFSV